MPIFVAGWLLLFMSGPLFAAELRVGFEVADITPPVGHRKGGGYGEIISTGVHDPLKAKAMLLRQGDVAFGLVICDLLSVPEPLSRKIRGQAARRIRVPEANIVVAATHNHGSPEYWGSLRDVYHEQAMALHGGVDPGEPVDYQSLLVERCVAALVGANDRLEPAGMQLVIAEQSGMAFNRRFHMRDGSVRFNPGKMNGDIVRAAGPIDPELPFLLFQGAERALGSLTVFAMHTATFGGSEFGADFPMHLATNLQRRFGPHLVSLFAEGAAGDINHIDVRSPHPQRGDKEPIRIGGELARTILAHEKHLRHVMQPSLAVRSRVVSVPIRPVSDSAYSRAKALLGTRGGVAFMARVNAWRTCHQHDLRRRHGGAKPLEVQAVRLNRDTAIVTLPHEVFVEIGMAIKAASPFRNTLVISLANDVDFYIPTRRAFEEGSYEVSTCPLEAGCGEMLTQAAAELLVGLKQPLDSRPGRRDP